MSTISFTGKLENIFGELANCERTGFIDIKRFKIYDQIYEDLENKKVELIEESAISKLNVLTLVSAIRSLQIFIRRSLENLKEGVIRKENPTSAKKLMEPTRFALDVSEALDTSLETFTIKDLNRLKERTKSFRNYLRENNLYMAAKEEFRKDKWMNELSISLSDYLVEEW